MLPLLLVCGESLSSSIELSLVAVVFHPLSHSMSVGDFSPFIFKVIINGCGPSGCFEIPLILSSLCLFVVI